MNRTFTFVYIPVITIPLTIFALFVIFPAPQTESAREFSAQVPGVHAYVPSEDSSNSAGKESTSINPLRRVLECRRLAENPSKEAFSRLAELARDESSIVRAHAVSALENYTTEESVQLLANLLASGDWRSRRVAATILADSSSPYAAAALAKALTDESPMVRNAARKALS